MADNEYNEEKEEEILDLSENVTSKESMFHHKLRKKDKKIKNSESYNNSTTIYIISLVALFVIWFTAFAQPLAYNNRLLLFNNEKKNDYSKKDETPNTPSKNEEKGTDVRKTDNSMWNVGFVNMNLKNKIGKSEELEAPSFTKTKASFHVLLNELGDEISYDIDIKNSGTIDAKVSDITINPVSEINDPILFAFSGIEVGDELDAGKTVRVSVNIKYNPNYTGPIDKISKDFVVLINYVQK